MLRDALPYLQSSAQEAILAQGWCWGQLSPIRIGSPALAPHVPKSSSRDLPAASWFIVFMGNSEFLGKDRPVPVMGDYLYLLKTAPHPERGCSPHPQVSLQ